MHDPSFAPWDDPNRQPLISFKNVSKYYGDVLALENQSFDIYAREFFALLGPSGCGKTTILRMLAGFENVSSGQILIDGEDIAGVPPNKRPVNMMFQSYALFPHLNVAQNIAFGLKREGMEKGRIAERVDEMLRLVQLQKLARRKPDQLSGGQRQRVALARALAKAPKLLLLDEPLGALDKKLRSETQFELMSIQEDLGCTFVVVTHDQGEAMTVSSRVAVMSEGKIVQIGTPDDIYETPQTSYVADFIGDVNMIPGVMKTSEEIETPLGQFQVKSKGFHPNDAAILLIRPEKFAITAPNAKTSTSMNRIEGKIEDIAYLGNLTTYHVRVGEQIIKAQLVNTTRSDRPTLTWGDDICLSWSASASLVLER